VLLAITVRPCVCVHVCLVWCVFVGWSVLSFCLVVYLSVVCLLQVCLSVTLCMTLCVVQHIKFIV
jgi:hypothetical protein